MIPRPSPSPESSAPLWRLASRTLALDVPRVAAILNVTPDSFSDGGRYQSLDAAVAAAERMFAEGADLIDIGGESTRPGAARIDAVEEARRVLPVLRAIRRRCPQGCLSVDTTRATVARAALEEGADAINDVSGLRLEEAMAGVVAEYAGGLILMHSRGSVEEMASFAHATYSENVAGEVASELQAAADRALAAGVARAAIVVDPGIGFAKRSAHSLAVLRDLGHLTSLGFPVMVGVSRKRVVGEVTGVSEPARRRDGSVGMHVAALARGARLFRVHDVAAHRQALDAAWAVLGPPGA